LFDTIEQPDVTVLDVSFFASLSSFQGTMERFFRNALRKMNSMPLTAAKSILPHPQAY
jgi:hypothetical protein